MGASKRVQMRTLAVDWADDIWNAVSKMNKGKGAGWRLPLAAIAITGCRPAALEKGIRFSIVEDCGTRYIQAIVPGTKVSSSRGQPEYRMRWATNEHTHREQELVALAKALISSPTKELVVQYDSEAISTRLREISRRLWPRRAYHITGYCYRELLSATAKAHGASPEEIAMAMGHLSTESQGCYARAPRRARGQLRPQKPWHSVSAEKPLRTARSPMARFKKATALAKNRGTI